MSQDVNPGRIVRYVHGNGDFWPLLVTSVDAQTDTINGRVFRDADDLKVAGVPYSDELAPFSWHWPQRVP